MIPDLPNFLGVVSVLPHFEVTKIEMYKLYKRLFYEVTPALIYIPHPLIHFIILKYPKKEISRLR